MRAAQTSPASVLSAACVDPWPGAVVVLHVPCHARAVLRAALLGVAAHQQRVTAWLEVGPASHPRWQTHALHALPQANWPLTANVSTWAQAIVWVRRLITAAPRAWIIVEDDFEPQTMQKTSVTSASTEAYQALFDAGALRPLPYLGRDATHALSQWLAQEDAKLIHLTAHTQPNPCEKQG